MKRLIFVFLWVAMFSLQAQVERFIEVDNDLSMADRGYVDEHDMMFKKSLMRVEGDDWYEPAEETLYPVLIGFTDPSYSRFYVYDSVGRMLTSHEQKWEDGKWIDGKILKYNYESDQLMIVTEYTFWEGEWYSTRITYTYDLRGNLLSRVRENLNRTTWTYDEANNLLTELIEDFSSVGWRNRNRRSYEYDDVGNRLTEVYEVFESNNKWKELLYYTYEYDDDGTLIKTTQEKSYGEIPRGEREVSVYSYDQLGRVEQILIDVFRIDMDNVSAKYKESYQYDESSGLLSLFLHEFMFEGEWTGSTRYTYAYNSFGNIVTGLYESYRPSAGWTSGCEMRWDYDDNGNSIVAESKSVGYFPKNISCELYYNNMKSNKNLFEDNTRAEVRYHRIGDPQVAVDDLGDVDGRGINVFSYAGVINMSANMSGEYVFEVIDVSGRVVKRGSFETKGSVRVERAGMYVVKVMAGGQLLSTNKVLVSRGGE